MKLKCYDLPANLSWLHTYDLSTSIFKLKRDWKRLFSKPTHPNLHLYTQSISSRSKILIVPCILEQFDLYSLVHSANLEGISCSVLISDSFLISPEEVSKALSILGPNTFTFALNLSYNTCQQLTTRCFAYNLITSPSKHFSSLPTHEDKSLILSSRLNHIYLKSSIISMDNGFPSGIQDLVPDSIPSITTSPQFPAYHTRPPNHSFPFISEKFSFFKPNRAQVLTKIFKSLLR